MSLELNTKLTHSIIDSFEKDERLFRFIRNKMRAIQNICGELEIETPYIQSDVEKHLSNEIKAMLILLLESMPRDVRQCRRCVSDI